MDRPVDILMGMIQQEVLHPSDGNCCPRMLTDEMLIAVFKLAKKHDLAGLAAHGLQKQTALAEKPMMALFQQEIFNDVYHYEKLNFTYQTLCAALENARIPFLPLKGAVLRQYYPQPWMRTSCDIDILVHKVDLDEAQKLLMTDLGFRKTGETVHDVSLFSQDSIHVELHFDLIERDRAGKSRQVLEQVWEHASPVREESCQYKLDDAMFYFYHIAHMAKHFERSGCGIRMFLDLHLLADHMKDSRSQIEALLKKSGLLAFDKAACELCRVWFSGQEHTANSQKLENFILEGGTFGTRENIYLANQRKHKSAVRFLLSEAFIPYESLKHAYPSLKKCPILTPFYWVYRWFQFLFGRKRTRLQEYFRILKNDSGAKVETIDDVLNMVGL